MGFQSRFPIEASMDYGGVIFLSVICMLFLSLSHIHLPKVSVRTFLAVFYMALGQCWKMSENKIRISLLSSIIFISVLLLVSILPLSVGSRIDGGMGVTTVKEISLYLPLSLLGIFGTWRISRQHKEQYFFILERYGKNSFHILTWHFLLFAIILNILFLCRCENLPSFEFPIARSRWWFVISILSMSLITGFMFLKDLLFNKQKKRMSLKRNVVYSSILTTSLYIFQFLTYPYVARVLGVVNIGICNFVQSLVQYFALFAILGTVTVGAREIAKCNSDKERQNQVFSSIVILNVLLTVLVLVCYIGATCFIPQFFKYKKLLYIGVFQLLSTPFTVEWLYRGLEDFKYITYRNLLVRAIYVLLIFALVRDRDDYYIYFALTVGLYVINAAINIFYCRHFVSFCWQPIVECCRKYIKPISFLGFQNILITMYTSFNVVFLGFFAGDKQVGYYTTATKIHGMILALFSAFTLVMMPRISSLVSMKKNEQVKYLLRQSISILFAFSFPMVIVVVALAPYIIQLIAGAEFVESVNLLRLSIPLIIVVGIEQILITQLLIPLGEDKSSSKSYIAGGIIGLISNVLLVPHWSSVGAIVVWALSEFTVMSFALFYVEQRLKLTRIICCSFFRYLLSFAPLAILVYCLASSPLCVIMLSIIYSHICLFYVIRNDIYVNTMKQLFCRISHSCLNNQS